MQPMSRRVEVSDGLSLHALEWSSEGVPLILIHGFGNEAHIWDDFAPRVAGHYRVIALSLRGHGDSDWDPERRYDYPNHVADLEAMTAQFGIERMVLVGHSLGGRVAMLYAQRHPEQLAGLVIVDSAPELDVRGTTRIRMEVADHQAPVFSSVAEYENLLAHNYPAATPVALKRMAANGLRQNDDGGYELKMDTAYRGKDGPRLDPEELLSREAEHTRNMWTGLEKAPCPTLVVRGAASDVMSPEVADRMVEEVLGNGTLAIVPQAGHSVMTDNPEGFAEAVCDFVLA
ncbi:MAG: alpha/beta hydrolase [Myxococcota bacterium]|nr:alpha/beta hydrolase [Myxococcota bacterium]